MLVSLRGVRINSVLSFCFLKQVSSDLLHVWVLVCCVFNFAVDCIWDYYPVVLFSSLCWGMTHKIHVNSLMKTVPRIHNLGQKFLRIVPVGCLSGRFDPVMTSPLASSLSMLFSQGRNDPAGLQHCFLGERGEEGSICNEQYNCTFKSFDSDVYFPEHFFQDCRIEKEKITYNKQIKCNWSKHTHTHTLTYSWKQSIY